MHGLYKRFLVFCAVFVGLMFAVVGFWALLGCDVPVRRHGAGGCAGARVHPSESRRS